MSAHRRGSLPVRGYLATFRLRRRVAHLTDALIGGFWLGVLRPEDLHEVDQLFYDKWKRYRDPEYLHQGLFDWEERVVERFFGGCRTVLVFAAGAGREVLALRRRGIAADGVECHPEMVEVANRLLESEGVGGEVRLAPRDRCPSEGVVYDGAFIGWGALSLIPGRDRRVALLRELRGQLGKEAPLLLSFFCRRDDPRWMKLSVVVATLFRWLLRREPSELGDTLAPNFIRQYSAEEVAAELAAGGFRLEEYRQLPYGHAVAIAAGPPEGLGGG